MGTGYSESLIRHMPHLSREDEVYALIQKHGAIYGYQYTWSPSLGEKQTVRGHYYVSPEENERAFARALSLVGYTLPRWWEFWRWGERKPPEGVRAQLRTERAQVSEIPTETNVNES